MIRERSGCVSAVLNSVMASTWPSTPTMAMYSPTRYGFVNMMVSPATILLNTP